MPCRGFSLVELLIATALTLILAAGMLSVAASGRAVSSAGAGAIELEERLRAVSEALLADIRAAGDGPTAGIDGRPLGALTPCILPMVIGSRADPPGTARTDAVSLLAAAPRSAAAILTAPFSSAMGAAQVGPAPGCPAADPACGVRAGDLVMVTDGRGQADLFDVQSVTASTVQLQPRGAGSGRGFPAGARLVPVTLTCYYVKAGTADEGTQLISGNGGTSELPFVDHVAGFEVTLLGDPLPPGLRPCGAAGMCATYGPSPPAAGVDDPGDGWPAGENCVFGMQDGRQVSRLPVLDGGAGLVALGPELLSDGPWCPDESAPNRVDADLFRVRAVRIVIGLEAASPGVRGANARLFAHPGTAVAASRWVADRQVTIDVVPRALHLGR